MELSYIGEVDLGPDAFDDIIRLQNGFGVVGQKLELTATPSGENNVLHLGIYNQALTDEAVMDLLADAGLDLLIEPTVLTAEELRALHAEALALAAAEAAAAEAAGETVEDEAAEPEEMVIEEEPEIIQLILSPMGNVEMVGTSLILLVEVDGRYEIVVLAASKEGMENSVNRLLD